MVVWCPQLHLLTSPLPIASGRVSNASRHAGISKEDKGVVEGEEVFLRADSERREILVRTQGSEMERRERRRGVRREDWMIRYRDK